MTWRPAAATMAVIGISIAAGAAVVGASDISFRFLFASASLTRTWSGGVGLFMVYRLLRCFWRPGSRFLVSVIVYAYASLLFLGLAAFEQLALFKKAAWPIAATTQLAPDADVRRAFWIGLAALALLIVGTLPVRRSSRQAHRPTGGWDELLPLASAFAATGLLGVAIITAKTHTIPLFASRIDTVRFSQGHGLGYASLLEELLLAAAAIAGVALIAGVRARRYALFLLIGSVGALVAFRVERTPLIVACLVLLFGTVYLGRAPRRRTILTVVPLAVGLAFTLGVYRLASGGTIDSRTEIVRATFDVAPEFREQAWVYRIYPAETPYIGRAAVAADVSSVVPSRALAAIGLNKNQLYGDISHQYVAAMQLSEHYPAGVAPLRVGFAGEMWADFGPWGLAIGILLFGFAVGLIDRVTPKTPLGVVRKAAISALLIFALFMPLGAWFPLALMVVGPMFVVQPLLLGRQLELDEIGPRPAHG